MDYPSAGGMAPQKGSSRVIKDSYYRLYILALLRLSPATLFHKINALPWYRGTLQSWADSLEYQTGDSILETGCATGLLTQYMARCGAVTYGVDKSPKMLRLANTPNTNGAHFELASALALPYENNRFDCVIAASLINIISEPSVAMREMVRVCKPAGKISVLVPQAGVVDEDIVNLANRLDLSGFSRGALTAWHRHAPKIQREKLLEYFRHAGLRKVGSATYLDGMVLTVTGEKQEG